MSTLYADYPLSFLSTAPPSTPAHPFLAFSSSIRKFPSRPMLKWPRELSFAAFPFLSPSGAVCCTPHSVDKFAKRVRRPRCPFVSGPLILISRLGRWDRAPRRFETFHIFLRFQLAGWLLPLLQFVFWGISRDRRGTCTVTLSRWLIEKVVLMIEKNNWQGIS